MLDILIWLVEGLLSPIVSVLEAIADPLVVAMGDSPALQAFVAIVGGVGALIFYFWGTNALLDWIWGDRFDKDGRLTRSSEKTREAIRPWLFVLPAMILLFVYLVFPAFTTLDLSFRDEAGREFVNIRNYSWAIQSPDFHESIRNNILWLLFVPFASTAFGLVVAVLADRVRWESLAKSIIFMPMAISFVGASIIWQFIYDFRDTGEQVGLLNGLFTTLGGDPQGWLILEPWNNFFLMIILVWIQTGFAMVLLSAALKGVPEETLEAARIDGASEVAIFFRIMIPQIIGTITVVMTTVTITVLKVFDIVYATTGGQNGTDVLANLMDTKMFRGTPDFGRGSAVAVTLMLATVPFMIWNIIRFRREEKFR